MPRRSSPAKTEVNPWLRYPVMFINLAILLITSLFVCMCAYSIYLRWDDVSFARGSFLVSLVVNVDVALLAVVTFLSLLSSLGFLGALRENISCLYYHDWMLLIMECVCLLGFVLLIITPYLATRDLQSIVSIELIERYRENTNFQHIIDFVQEEYKCCGLTEAAYLDWNSNIYFNCSKGNPCAERCSVPSLCCRESDTRTMETELQRRFCGYNVLAMSEQEAWEKVNTRNCVLSFTKSVQQKSIVLCVAAVVMVCVLLVVRSMASQVRDEIGEITRLYNRHQRELQRRERVHQRHMRAQPSLRPTQPQQSEKKNRHGSPYCETRDMPRRGLLLQKEVNPWLLYPVMFMNLAIFFIAMAFVGMCAYSIYLRWDDVSFARGSFLVSLVVNVDVALLVVVAFLSFVSSLGFLGALKENITCLFYYDWLLFILVIGCALSFGLLIVTPYLAT